MTTPTNRELAEQAQRRFDSGVPAVEAVRAWLRRHVPTPDDAWTPSRDYWLDWAANNFVNDPEIGPYLREPAVTAPELPEREEFRCTEATVLELQRRYPPTSSHWLTLIASMDAFGIPVIVTDRCPAGKIQFWRGDEMVEEVDVP